MKQRALSLVAASVGIWCFLAPNARASYAPEYVKVESRIEEIGAFLADYSAQEHRYPSNDNFPEELREWLAKKCELDPVLAATATEALRDAYLTDPWGHKYVYECRTGDAYRLYSSGLDGHTKTVGSDQDDINSWDARKSWRPYYDRRLSWIMARHSAGVWVWPFLLAACAFFVALLLFGRRRRRAGRGGDGGEGRE